jgi:hypothetical protein
MYYHSMEERGEANYFWLTLDYKGGYYKQEAKIAKKGNQTL